MQNLFEQLSYKIPNEEKEDLEAYAIAPSKCGLEENPVKDVSKQDITQSKYESFLFQGKFTQAEDQEERSKIIHKSELELSQEKTQEIYADFLKNGRFEDAYKLKDFAQERGINLKTSKEDIDRAIANLFVKSPNQFKTKREDLEKIAEESSLDLDIKQSIFSMKEEIQELYKEKFREGSLGEFGLYSREIKRLSEEYGNLGIDLSQEDVNATYLNQFEKRGFIGDQIRDQIRNNIKELTEGSGLDSSIPSEILEKIPNNYQESIRKGDIGKARALENDANKSGISLNASYEDMREGYISHIRKRDGVPEGVEKFAKEKGYDLNVESEKFETESKFDNTFVGFYGTSAGRGIESKFILGKDTDNSDLVKIIADNNLKKHEEISKSYNVETIGGGHIDFDPESKNIQVYDVSMDYGPEPRILTGHILQEAFPDYNIELRD